MVVAAGGDEDRRAEVGLDLEAEDVAVEAQALVDVADVQVQVPHPQPLADLRGQLLALRRRQQRVEVQRRRAAGVAQVGRPRVARRSAASSMPLPSGSGR
jgi:hypothetical protein